MDIPFDSSVNAAMLQKLESDYPFAAVRCIGRSRLGKGIYSVCIGSKRTPALYAGGFHGCEWLTCMCLQKFLLRLCDSVKNDSLLCGASPKRALAERGVCIIPCVNPDGTDIAVHGADSAGRYRKQVKRLLSDSGLPWSANAAGVDINHNFDAGWKILRSMELQQGIKGPAPSRFGGEFPESEPETKAVASLSRRVSFRQAMALHSQGEEIYWRYGENTPERSRMMARILSSCSGYELVDNAGMCSHGGFKDWFIETMGRPAFTVEIGKGKNPLPVSELDSIYARIEEMLTLFMLM